MEKRIRLTSDFSYAALDTKKQWKVRVGLL